MTKPPAGNISVTTEVGYCPFCRRTRTLRREERHLGGLVRTNIDCESCHRNLSSTLGPPGPAPVEAPAAPPAPLAPAEPPAEPASETTAPARPAKAQPPPKPVRAPIATKTRKPAASTAKKPATRAGSTAKKK